MSQYGRLIFLIAFLWIGLVSQSMSLPPPHHHKEMVNHHRSSPVGLPWKTGKTIRVLPPQHRKIRFRNIDYYFLDGEFYLRSKEEYQVVQPPVGLKVQALPDEAERLNLNGKKAYKLKGIIYEPFGDQYRVKDFAR